MRRYIYRRACVLEQTPAVISIGTRCKKGYYFVWLPGRYPVMVTPKLQRVPLDILNNVPYLLQNGLHVQLRDPVAITQHTGVDIVDGHVKIVVSDWHAEAALPAHQRGGQP